VVDDLSEVRMTDVRPGATGPDRPSGTGAGAGSAPPRRGWLVVYALLAPAVILPLWVSLYDRETPTFLSFPFFYWFQFLLIIIAVALTGPAYLLSRRLERSDRVAHGLPPVPPEDGAGRDATDTRGGAR
jgi:hypothetical protein